MYSYNQGYNNNNNGGPPPPPMGGGYHQQQQPPQGWVSSPQYSPAYPAYPHQQPPQHQPHYSYNQGPPPPLHYQQPQQQQQQQPPPQPRYETAPPQPRHDSSSPVGNNATVMPQYSQAMDSSVNGASVNNLGGTYNNLNSTSNGFSSTASRLRFDNQVARPELLKVTPITVEDRTAKALVAAVDFHKRMIKGLTTQGRKLANQEIANTALRQDSAIEMTSGGGAEGGLGSRKASMATIPGSSASAGQPQAPHENPAEEKKVAEKLDTDELDDEGAATLAVAARGEHNHAQLSLCDSPRQHIGELGSGIVYYFEFVKFIAVFSFAFVILQVIHYARFADTHKPPFKSRTGDLGTRNWFDDFTITGYTDSDYASWVALNVVAVVLTFVAGPVYFFIMWRREITEDKDALTEKGVAQKRDRLLRIDTKTGLFDVSYHYRTNRELFVRRTLGILIILSFLGVQTVASYFLTRASATASFGISFAIAIISGVLTGFFTFVSQFVVELMKIQTYSRWKLAHTVSLMFIRLGNVVAVYAAKNYTLDPDTKCSYDLVGEQFISLLFIEIFAMNFVTVALLLIQNKYAAFIADKTKSVFGDEDNLPPFDLATFYLNIVYRHYVVIMAMVVAPLTICLSFVGFILQYWVDKFLLFKICGTPRRIYSSQKNFLSVTLFCVALCSLLTPYAGSMFIMSGITGEFSKLCAFPRYR